MRDHSSSSLGPRAARPHRAPPGARISQSAQLQTSYSRWALTAGEPPAVPVKSLSEAKVALTYFESAQLSIDSSASPATLPTRYGLHRGRVCRLVCRYVIQRSHAGLE